jgi:hypothetical protein
MDEERLRELVVRASLRRERIILLRQRFIDTPDDAPEKDRLEGQMENASWKSIEANSLLLNYLEDHFGIVPEHRKQSY